MGLKANLFHAIHSYPVLQMYHSTMIIWGNAGQFRKGLTFWANFKSLFWTRSVKKHNNFKNNLSKETTHLNTFRNIKTAVV